MGTPDIYIGLMSGTSLDGIDVAAVSFNPKLKLIATHSEAIPERLKQKILQLTQPGDNEIDLMGLVDIELGQLFAKAANSLIRNQGLDKKQIRAIGSHGQTIRHRPEFNYTLQIGDANIIAENTGITTVSDFRRRDMAAGGQGAPLVPAFHDQIFRTTNRDRILLNIGGMANLTYLPAIATEDVLGFDTGPGNVLMDAWITQTKDCPYDKNGAWAQTGNCDEKLLNDLLQLPYFHEKPPKSTGREQFHLSWLSRKLKPYSTAAADVQATLLDLTARTVTDSINKYIPSKTFELLVCGGGSRNKALMNRLQELLPHNKVYTTDDAGIDADWMEAAAFAWLAKQCMESNSGNKPSVTGAKGERILGAIYQI